MIALAAMRRAKGARGALAEVAREGGGRAPLKWVGNRVESTGKLDYRLIITEQANCRVCHEHQPWVASIPRAIEVIFLPGGASAGWMG